MLKLCGFAISNYYNKVKLALLEKGIVSPHEAFMKAIDKSRFKPFLSAADEALANAAGGIRDDEKRPPGNLTKPTVRLGAVTR